MNAICVRKRKHRCVLAVVQLISPATDYAVEQFQRLSCARCSVGRLPEEHCQCEPGIYRPRVSRMLDSLTYAVLQRNVI